MAAACSSSSSEQESDSNEIFDLSSSDGFSSSSSHSYEGDSRTGLNIKSKTGIEPSSEGAKGCVKTSCGNSFIQHICTSASNHANTFLEGSLKL